MILACALLAVLACGSPEAVADASAESTPVAESAASDAPGDAAEVEATRARRAARKAATKEAMAMLQAMSDFLAAQESLRFEADIAYDSVQRTGHKLEFGGTRSMVLRRPDRLRIEAERRNGEASTLTFDGQHLAIDLADEEAYVRVEAPGSVDEMVDYLVLELGVPMPLADLIHSNLYGEVADQIDAALYVEDSRLGERWCRHLAFSGATADLQLWIEEGDRPVPCRIVLTYKHEPGSPQFSANLRNWDFTAATPDDLFAFSPAEGAERISIRAAAAQAQESREVN